MSIRSLFGLVAVSSIAFAVGCAAAHDTSTTDEEVGPEQASSTDAVSKKLPSPAVATQRLYFPNAAGGLPYGGGNRAWPYPTASDGSITSYWVFAAKGGVSFDAYVTAYNDGDALSAPVTITAYYLLSGKWHRYDASKGTGTTSLTLSPMYDHQWLIKATGKLGNNENNLEIGIDCSSGADAAGHSYCALSQEPGDACGGIAASAFQCDANLYCDFGASCGAGDMQGKCMVQPSSCPTTKGGGPAGSPVCGCDGTTYDSACLAQEAGVSIASNAACGAPPSCDWAGSSIDASKLTTTLWRSADLKYRYLFDASGTVQAIHDPCAAPPGVIHCEIAAQVKNGTWAAKGVNLDLEYSDGTRALLVEQADCKGNQRLDGTDWGVQVDALDAGAR